MTRDDAPRPRSAPGEPPVDTHPEGLAPVVDRNIQALIARRKAEERERGAQERIADGITRFTGSMRFVYIHLALFGGWIVANLGVVPGVRPWDESFVVLAMMASVEAIFLSTFVLISQNRMQALADERADLDLHVSLLTEHEVTRLITLVAAMAAKMEIDEARDPELDQLEMNVAPEKVMDRIEEAEATRDAQA